MRPHPWLMVGLIATASCQPVTPDSVEIQPPASVSTSEASGPDGESTSTAGTPSPSSSPTSRTIDCFSGMREPQDSRDYLFRVRPVARPEEVIAIPVGGSPLDLGIADSGLWVTVGTADQQGAYHLAKIDPVSNEFVDSVELEDAHAVVVSEAVWVTQTWRDTVIRFDPAEAQPTVNIPLPPLEPETLLGGVDPCFGPGDLSLGEGGLWVDGRGAMARIDVASDQVVAVISPPAGETAKGAEVLAAIGSVWLTSNGQHLWRVDPKSNTWAGGLAIAPDAGHSVNSVATASGRLWVSGADLERDAQGNVTNVLSPDGSGISEVDPADGSVVRTVHFDESNLMIASDGIERLVAWEQGVGLWLIDEADEVPKKLWVCSPAEASGIAVDDEIVWVAIFEAGEVWRIDLQAAGMGCPAA